MSSKPKTTPVASQEESTEQLGRMAAFNGETMQAFAQACQAYTSCVSTLNKELMGFVSTRLNRDVALKFLTPQLNDNEEARQRFYAEAKAISKVDHPNVCVILDIGESPEGQLYFSMPFYGYFTITYRLYRSKYFKNKGKKMTLS